MNGHRDVTEISHVNVAIDDLKNGQSGKLTLNADVKMESNPPAPETNGVLEAKLKGNFSFALGADLKPSSVQGNTHLEVTRATGGLSELASLVAEFELRYYPHGNQTGRACILPRESPAWASCASTDRST